MISELKRHLRDRVHLSHQIWQRCQTLLQSHAALANLPLSQAFTEVLSNNETWSTDMTETYKLLDIDPASVQGLEDYLKVG